MLQFVAMREEVDATRQLLNKNESKAATFEKTAKQQVKIIKALENMLKKKDLQIKSTVDK